MVPSCEARSTTAMVSQERGQHEEKTEHIHASTLPQEWVARCHLTPCLQTGPVPFRGRTAAPDVYVLQVEYEVVSPQVPGRNIEPSDDRLGRP
ncbi:hypothetical protein CCMA1212_002080 [Trichoderma ghanense]|uniref:Uncharacterized protein n=1 Tax=Trichoderma ghanense TaxID=65468 RepID=A0ABY2HET2_9HYPO